MVLILIANTMVESKQLTNIVVHLESVSLSWAWLVLSLFSGRVYSCIHHEQSSAALRSQGQVYGFILIFVWLIFAGVYQILFRQRQTPHLHRHLIDIYQRTYHDELLELFKKKAQSKVRTDLAKASNMGEVTKGPDAGELAKNLFNIMTTVEERSPLIVTPDKPPRTPLLKHKN